MNKFTLPKLNISLPGLTKQKFCIGLDIGSFAIKICELSSAGKGYKLIKLGSAKLPFGAVEDGVLQDPESVGNTIKALIKNLKITNNKVAISISGYSVIVKKINLEVMSSDQLEAHIQTEAEQYIPFDIDEVYLDFQDLHTSKKNSERTDVMLVAAKKDVVNAYLDMLDGLGLKTVVVDVDAFALENSYENILNKDENIALIDIGASKMSINIISQGTSILARDVVMGSGQITELIQSKFDMNFEEAEAVKVGIHPPGEHKDRITEIFVSTCTQWILEIKKALDFYISNHPGETIDRLVLSGGGAKILDFDKFVQYETGINTELFDPFANIEKNPNKIDALYLAKIGPEMAISAGLAIRKTAW